MTNPSVILEKTGRVARLVLNRPQMKNAMDDAMALEFASAVTELKNDAQTGVVVITGAADAFCAGGNLKMLQEQLQASAEVNQDRLLRFYRSFLSVLDLEIPVIAAIRGPAIGAGACLALACDIRLAAPSAKLGFTFIRLGINPGMGAEYLLTALVGPARAMELLMTGDVIHADRAAQLGLVNTIVKDEALDQEAMALAGRLGSMPALPLRVIKEQVRAASRQSLDDALVRASSFQGICCQSPQTTEGIQAVLEKRPPKFH